MGEKERNTQAQVWKGSSRLTSSTSVFLGTGRIMCLYACTRLILFAQQALTTVTTGGRIEKSATAAKEQKERKKKCARCYIVYVLSQHNTMPFICTNISTVLDICNLTCVWAKARVTEITISRCFLLSCSPYETFHPTLSLTLLRIKREGGKLTNLLATRFHWLSLLDRFTKTWVNVVKNKQNKTAASKRKTPFLWF